jgi:Ion channel
MLKVIFAAWCLVAATVIIHAAGLAKTLRPLLFAAETAHVRFWPVLWLLMRVVWVLIVIHLLEIAVWALFFWWKGCLPDAESSFYFAGVTYTTLGYGDVVLTKPWRMLGPIEGLTGILMCGLSTGFIFALVSRIHSVRAARRKGDLT